MSKAQTSLLYVHFQMQKSKKKTPASRDLGIHHGKNREGTWDRCWWQSKVEEVQVAV
jgi:hypothetical protein